MKGIRNSQLFADVYGRWVLNFLVARHGAGALSLWVVVDTVFRAFANEHATMLLEMADEINTFHKSRDRYLDFFACNSRSRTRLFGQFAICFEQDLNGIA